MLQLDISAALGRSITPLKGIPDKELSSLSTSLRRYIDDFLKEREDGEHAWSMDPYNSDAVEEAMRVAEKVRTERIRTVVWIGIGGSGLGPKVIQEVFESPDTVELILLDTLDPAILELTMEIVDWKSTLVVVASKSGGTLEPMSVFALCWDKLKEVRKDKAKDYCYAITDPESGHLRSFCLENEIPMLPIPSGVGGRYSIFTPIGLLPVALLGGDVQAFVRGAKEIDTLCQNLTVDENPAAKLAAVQYLLDTKRDYSVRVIMPYSQRLESIARWNQQLVAESLGKVEIANPIPLAAIGTQDQHSMLQQWMEGPRAFWHLFIREDEKRSVTVPEGVSDNLKYIAGKEFGELLDACYQGTSQALTNAKRPHATITLPVLDEYHLGQLFFLMMVEVVLLGRLYRIDPYGQPGVEAGKVITKEILGGA